MRDKRRSGAPRKDEIIAALKQCRLPVDDGELYKLRGSQVLLAVAGSSAPAISECFSICHSLLLGSRKTRTLGESFVHGSEFKAGHVANCNKYLARARICTRFARLKCMKDKTCRIYISRFPVLSSFEDHGLAYPPDYTACDHMYLETAVRNKQQATTLLQVDSG